MIGAGDMENLRRFMMQKVKEVFGNRYELQSMERLLGGAQKHTYLAKTQNGFNFVIYIWDQATSYFSYDEENDIFLSSSAKLFELNNYKMCEVGVRVPKLYYMDRNKNEQQYAYAFAEYIDGTDMDEVLEEKVEQLAKKIKPRKEYTFIHGELGPNHVMVNKNNEAFLIDIEGAKYGDVEEEASFLKLRFGTSYEKIVNQAMDEERMRFYHLGHCLGNLSGAMALKNKGYYDMEDLNGMIKYFKMQLKKAISEEV